MEYLSVIANLKSILALLPVLGLLDGAVYLHLGAFVALLLLRPTHHSLIYI